MIKYKNSRFFSVFPVTSVVQKNKGFSLLELMIVLVLGGMLTGVVATTLSSGPVLRKTAHEVMSSLRHARSIAIMRQKPIVWKMDIETKKFWIDTATQKSKKMKESIDAKIHTAESEVVSQSVGGVRFFPDGSSTGGKVDLIYNKQKYVVNVEWITGRISLE